MKHRSLVCTLILGLALALTSAFAQNQYYAPAEVGGGQDVQQFAQWSAHTTNAVGATGSQSVTLDNCYIPLGTQQQNYFPLAVGVSVKVLDAAGGSETVVITAVSAPAVAFGSASPGATCGFTGSFANTHPLGVKVISGDAGLGEAVTILKSFGGRIYVTSLSGVTTAQITALTVGAYNVSIEDGSGANANGPQLYSWNGTNYVFAGGTTSTVSGAQMVPFVCDNNVVLSTVSATTVAGSATCIPANAIILGVTGRVTTAITGTCSGWSIGDTGTAARFIAAGGALTLGSTKTNTGTYQTTAIAVAATGITSQSTGAEALQITCATGAASAGAIRVTAFGFAIVNAAQ